MPVFLSVYHSGKLVVRRQFVSDQISIGSNTDGPSLVLADPSVCFWHALIESHEGEYRISDLGSPTGTFVNSKQILESSLKHGDQIQIGDFVIQFFVNVPFAQMGTPPEEPKAKKPRTLSQSTSTKMTSNKKASPPQQQPVEPPVEPPPPVQQQPVKPPPVKPPPVQPVQQQPVKPPPVEPPPPVQQQPVKPPPVEPPPVQPVQQQPVKPPPMQPVQQQPVKPPPVEPPPKEPPPSFSSNEESQYLKQESPSVQEVDIEGLNVPEEFIISPLDKQQKEKTGVSPLEKTEVLPASSVSDDSFIESSVYETTTTQTVEAPPVQLPPGAFSTYAPKSAIQDLDEEIPPGSGPIVEVLVAWKERVLSIHHFKENNRVVTFGSDPKADILCPNLVRKSNYTLLEIKQNTVVHLSDGVKASVVDHKGKHSFDKLVEKGLVTTSGSNQVLSLNQSQLVRLDFSSSLKVYVRYSNRIQKAVAAGLFDFNFSEMMGLMMSFFFMSVLVFYLALFSPQFLESTEDLEEEGIKKASIEFKKKRVVKLKLAEKARKKKTKLSIPHKQKVPKKRKKVGIKKQGSAGRLGQVAAKPKAKSKKKTITSARSGGAVTTKKSGAGPKSPRPDPTKLGLLGVFGKKGTQKVLDKAYSGTGELAGLAEQATGYAGQKESYTGEGIGTRFKNAGAGGKGSALIGVSAGIKTKGRGGGAKSYGTGGSLGQRGAVQLELGTSDWEVEGGVDKNAILRVIRRNKHQLEWCYETALQKKPDLEGKVLVQWDILNERVRRVKVKNNTTRDSSLARCLMSRLKNFRFTGTGLQKGQIGEVSIPFAVTKK